MEKKNKQFKPCKTFRYLLGNVTKDKCKADLDEYNKHRYKVFTATAIVDHHPLKMNPYDYVKTRKLREDVSTLRHIDMQNRDLLKKINMINRKGGYVDSYNPLAYRRIDKWSAHIKDMKEIDNNNKWIYKTILTVISHYNAKVMDETWKVTFNEIKHSCKLPLVIFTKPTVDEVLQSHPSISEGLEKGNIQRPLCFLEFQVKNGKFLGRLVIELYYDHVPVTVQNFLEICKGENLTYKNCLVHRIVKGQYLETGDITKGNGRGGFSIYGKTFQEENHMLRHTRTGILSMKRVGSTENNSQFCITFSRMDQLDHKNVVFGKVIKGNEILFVIQDFGRKIGKPYADIIISNCGEIPVTPQE
ncbi:hypothetical protein NQ314_012601 [Rhamnusium bicolor]|uniref:PPIase cyclophilin-type domain-containing protein n=1 Tax=Rhamnusium bicolor TaxID=1586634 RepID=A0AAV8XBG8_9CUCU|nr:hypothetical protein NQ314_012601 [Rhamnusium bicolor]